MTHTTFNEIESHLKHGLHVVVERDSDFVNVFMVISPNKDNDGNYRMSSWRRTSEESRKRIGAEWVMSKEVTDEEAETDLWQIVDTFHTPAEPFEVSKEVEVIETGEIRRILYKNANDFLYKLHSQGWVDEFTYAHTELRPVLPTYEEDDATQDAIQLLKDNGYTITRDNRADA